MTNRRSFIAAVLAFFGLRPNADAAVTNPRKQLTFIHPQAARKITVGKTGRVIWVVNHQMMEELQKLHEAKP